MDCVCRNIFNSNCAIHYFFLLKGQHDLAMFLLAVSGALLGYLRFNLHPAKIFMGDTGSLAIGGLLAATAMVLKQELLLIIIGGVFLMEVLSVIIQVTSFKLTGKRVLECLLCIIILN